jgi:hypothetical protein
MTPLRDIVQRATAVASLAADATPARRVFRCERCGVSIGRNAWACDACIRQHLADLRSQKLAPARSSVPERHRTARFGTRALGEYVRASESVLRGAMQLCSQRVVFIFGPAGAGKTSLACAMLHEVIEAGANLRCSAEVLERARGARFAECYELSMARAKHALGRDTPPELADALRASVLVLDELGREDGRNRDVEAVVSRRYRDSLPTFVTTWMTPDEIRNRYDEGIYRRLCEGAAVISLGDSE